MGVADDLPADRCVEFQEGREPGRFPSDDAVIKLLWLAIRDIEDKRARQRAKEAGKAKKERKASGKLIEGATTQGWKACLGALVLAYPDRLNGRI